jgi:hypothetical protein
MLWNRQRSLCSQYAKLPKERRQMTLPVLQLLKELSAKRELSLTNNY